MGTFSMLLRILLGAFVPIFSFVLIFSNLLPIYTGLIGADSMGAIAHHGRPKNFGGDALPPSYPHRNFVVNILKE